MLWDIPRPSVQEVEQYMAIWDSLENYVLQESSLKKLFTETYPKNTDINDILIKVSSLNDFYSTNILNTFAVAKHICSLDIDKRLSMSDNTLINEIALIQMPSGKTINFYSFATKYCSHHFPINYPIYDSYVEKILIYFRNKDSFCEFKKYELKNYIKYYDILIAFKNFYSLNNFTLKEIDKYIWQLGKKYFIK